jgi:hypothetical protein
MRRRRGIVVVAAMTIGAAVVVGGVIAGGFDWSRSAEQLDAALVDAQPTRVADIPASDGHPARGVFAQITSTGHFCLSDAPLDAPLMGGGGCNPLGDPLGGRAISASLAYDGGPAIETVRDARLVGLAASNVATARVLMSDGSLRAVKLKRAQVGSDELSAFGFRVRKSDLKKGIGPVAVVAYEGNDVEIGRQPTGIG